jgi:hypothetical protein
MRYALAVVLFAASAASTAPLPKALKTNIALDASRPLLIRRAVVVDGKVKLSGPHTWSGSKELLTLECPLHFVTAHDSAGKRIDARELAVRLKRSTMVVVPGFGNWAHPTWPPPVVDSGDGWQQLLAADTVVIHDVIGVMYGWYYGQFDVLIDLARVDGRRVLATPSEKVLKRSVLAWKTEWVLDPDELEEVDTKEWEAWAKWVDARGVAMHVRGAKAPSGFEEVFREGMPPRFRTKPANTVEGSLAVRGVIR